MPDYLKPCLSSTGYALKSKAPRVEPCICLGASILSMKQIGWYLTFVLVGTNPNAEYALGLVPCAKSFVEVLASTAAYCIPPFVIAGQPTVTALRPSTVCTWRTGPSRWHHIGCHGRHHKRAGRTVHLLLWCHNHCLVTVHLWVCEICVWLPGNTASTTRGCSCSWVVADTPR